jgi:hypothetical protein
MDWLIDCVDGLGSLLMYGGVEGREIWICVGERGREGKGREKVECVVYRLEGSQEVGRGETEWRVSSGRRIYTW